MLNARDYKVFHWRLPCFAQANGSDNDVHPDQQPGKARVLEKARKTGSAHILCCENRQG